MILYDGKIIYLNLGKVKEVVIESIISSGASGYVYKVRDTTYGDIYALKHIRLKEKDPNKLVQLVIKMTEEAKLNLSSTYIVTAYGLTKIDNLEYVILFEYVSGIGLDEWIVRNSLTSLEKKRNLFIEILKGVNVAHRNGICHKDLKPQNIKITSDNKPKILDFGLASTKDKNITRELAGTIPYMAPELYKGIDTKEKVDIFALGCILYEMIKGSNYFVVNEYKFIPVKEVFKKDGFSNKNIIDLDNKFPQSSEFEELLANIIRKATAFNPVFRYDTIDEILHDIKQRKITFTRSLPIIQKIKNNELKCLSISSFLFHYSDIVLITVGYILGQLFSIFYFIFIPGIILAYFRISFLYSESKNGMDFNSIIKKYPGNLLILTGEVFFILGLFSLFFGIFGLLISWAGVYIRGSLFHPPNIIRRLLKL